MSGILDRFGRFFRSRKKPAQKTDVFGSIARRKAQEAKDAEIIREPVPSAFSGGRGVLNLRSVEERVEARAYEDAPLEGNARRKRRRRARLAKKRAQHTSPANRRRSAR